MNELPVPKRCARPVLKSWGLLCCRSWKVGVCGAGAPRFLLLMAGEIPPDALLRLLAAVSEF